MLRRTRRVFLIVLGSVCGLAAVLALALTFTLRGSLPRLDGERVLPGVQAPVTVTRDSLGIPHIQAANRLDATRTLGYVHAQDRFFQMDLQRRGAAGELAALLGTALVSTDRQVRIHRFRDVARRVVSSMPARHLDLLDAYTAGVNAGLADLPVRPFEYLALRRQPEPWLMEDTILTICAMFLDLDYSTATTEKMNAMVADILPGPLADYLLTPAAHWDAPVQDGPPYPVAIPDASEVDLRAWTTDSPATTTEGEPIPTADTAGSNSWAVAGSLTAHGGALLANDMHLSLGLPNIWYRARVSWPDSDGTRSLVGTTLPGNPGLVTGSNGDVAWGLTVAYADALDLVRLEMDPADSTRYRTPDGWQTINRLPEVITVAGADPDTLWVRQTRWGPVWSQDAGGAPLVLRWSAHDIEAVNLGSLDIETTHNVDEAVLAAAGAGIPTLNFVCADRAGNIAWTITGRLPKRHGWDGRLPVSWADGSCGWTGYRDPGGVPKILRPAEGLLWTANNRVAGGEDLRMIGDGGFGLGARAQQIRDGLRAMDRPAEADMLALQLDDRALFLNEWRLFALAAVADDTTASRREFARLLREDWDGHASVASAGYRLVRAFSYQLIDKVYRGLTGPVWSSHDEFEGKWLSSRHAITWELVHIRPPHMLPPVFFTSWDELILAAVDGAMDLATADGRAAADWTWGRRNIVDISHPFLNFMPQLRRWLAAPAQALPGDGHMPRVQHQRHGASQRMVVSPGREKQGIFHMPGGQSGHPLSPYFLAGHEDWVSGRASRLLPGAAVHRLELVPDGN